MKKLMTIFGAFFLASVVLTSCTDDKKNEKKKERVIDVKDLHKNIESEEDAVEAMMTIMEAEIKQWEKAKGPWQELADIQETKATIRCIPLDVKDFEDLDIWDDYEDLEKELEDKEEELQEIMHGK